MLGFLFRGSWVKKVVMAVLCFGLAYFAFLAEQKTAAEREAARLAGVPPAVSLNAFDPKADVHPYDEVNVIGWINTKYNYELVQQRKKNGIATGKTTKRMFVLFGPDDSADSRRARAAVVIDPSVVDAFLDEIVANMEGAGPDGLTFRLSGRRTSPVLESMANDAMAEAGLEKAENFSFIVPWLGQRDARLAPKTGQMPVVPMGLAAGGVLYLLLAGLAFRGRRKAGLDGAPRQGQGLGFGTSYMTSAMPNAGLPSGLGPFAAPAQAVPLAVAKGHTPRWLLPAFALIALGVLGYQFGGGWVTGLVMLAVLVFGAVQVKRVLNTGLAGVLGAVTAGKPAQDGAALAKADAPIRSTPSVAAQVGAALNGKGAGVFKLLPLALGVGLMAVSGVVFGQFDKMVSLSIPAEMNRQAADTAPAKASVPEAAGATATLADPAPIPAPTPAVAPVAARVAPDVPTPSPADPVAAQAPAADALAVETVAGAAVPLVIVQAVAAFLVLLAVALVLWRLRKPQAVADSLGDTKLWARLDRMVAAERARS